MSDVFAYITHPDCLLHEMGPHHPECPERLTAIETALQSAGLLDHLTRHSAPLANDEQLLRAHSQSHLDHVIATAPDHGYAAIDADTIMNMHTLNAARRAAGAAVLATDLVLSGQARAAFCAVRPPGHHAERERAMGFCFFNNVAVGILHALEAHGLQRIALIDFDVHHGNGSEDIFHNDPRVLMCSIFERDLYPFSGEPPRGANMINVGLPAGANGKQLKQAFEQFWRPALDAFQPEMIVFSAGFDAHQADPLGRLNFLEDDYASITASVMQATQASAQGRVVSCLEGGYQLKSLGESVKTHLQSLQSIDL